MNRRSLPVAAALATAAALLLTACGGGSDKSKDSDKIAGADTGASKSASPSPSASTAPGVKRPKITLPSDISYTFDWPKTGNKDKDAILSDGEQSIKAVDMAIAKQKSADPAYEFYYEGEAAAGTEVFVKKYVDHKARTTGHYRFYSDSVTINKDGTAAFSYCEDQSKAYVKYLKDGKVAKTPVTKKSYVSYDTALRKNDQGVWVIEKMYSQVGSAKCQP
ncbi:hypothetical protein AB0436_13575 [Streptomyces sp. NPDC051322]|uniref:hypothetical protein n=1 Tax=Streptomyces sp. NPDC051322 TaxID=3154645 RepID=UPI00344E03E4